MKRDYFVDCRNCDGKIVHTVLTLMWNICFDVEYMFYKTIPAKENEIPKNFKPKTDKDTATNVKKVRNMSRQVKDIMFQFD